MIARIARLTVARFFLPGLAASALAPAPAVAQDQGPLHEAIGAPDNLTLSASFRVRYEALSGQFRPGLDEDDDLVTFRTILFAEYDAGPVRIGGELIDARAYAGDAGGAVGTGEVNAFELVQAYVGADLGEAFGTGTESSFEAGRFVLDLGSRRLVGRNNFRNTTNAFTGMRFDWQGAGDEALTLFYTLPQSRLPSDKASILGNDVEWDRESFDLTFWGGILSLPGVAAGGTLELYTFVLDEDDGATRPTRNRELITPGFRFFRNPGAGRWDYEIEAAGQFGSIRAGTAADAARQDVSAWTFHAEAGHQLAGAWSPRLALELDGASGDGPGDGFGRFDSLYGPRRPDWGPTGIYGPLGRSNILSPGLRLEIKPDSRWDGFVFYRALWLEEESDSFAFTGVRDPAGANGSFAGHQVEARARYWILPRILRLEVGGAVLFNGGFLENAPNASGNGDTAYGYADITFTF
jgi:hypothetical protein